MTTTDIDGVSKGMPSSLMRRGFHGPRIPASMIPVFAKITGTNENVVLGLHPPMACGSRLKIASSPIPRIRGGRSS
jgi:hypothetical protein